MAHLSSKRVITLLGILLAIPMYGSGFAGSPPDRKTIAELRDFTAEELKFVGLRLDRDMTVHVNALGGGDDRGWRNPFSGWFGDDERDQMFAYGWIINADTRERVWEMTYGNTRGRSDHRTFDDEISLSRGSYELYFAAPSYFQNKGFSNFSINIDRRREESGRDRRGRYEYKIRGDRDLQADFMGEAKDYGITLAVAPGEASDVHEFSVPLKRNDAAISAVKLNDREYVRKGIVTTRDVPIHIYAVGEGRKRDEMFDYGWIVDTDTRERVWEMGYRNTDHAGGSTKNLKFDGDVTLPKGRYELTFVTDDSHSSEDWNAPLPYDPLNYGIQVSLKNERDREAFKVTDAAPVDQNVIVSITKMEDGDFRSAGFTLKADMKVRIYAIGEGPDTRGEMADYGWIVNAKTRDRVWSMDRRNTYHAGGASKNRLADEVMTLPKGSYIAYYATDGSHAYNEWNSDPPFDEEHWGLLIAGVDEHFDSRNVATYSEEAEDDVLVQLIRVGDGRHESRRFTLTQPTTVRVYALGEGQSRRMYDYGWIEDAKTGRVVWEMTYGMTTSAGGARKNRMVNTSVSLDKGEYEIHYKTDDSHAFNDWNDDPPEDRMKWGITLYKTE